MVNHARSIAMALLAVATIASIADAAPQKTSASRGEADYAKALRFFKAEEYEAALPHFEKAYELSEHRPSTVLGLAQCERMLKMYERALEHFAEYLAAEPTGEKADKVRETIRLVAEILAKAKEREVAAAKEVERTAAPLPSLARTSTVPRVETRLEKAPPQRDEGPSLWPWACAGVSVAGLATGITFGLVARGSLDKSVVDPRYADAESRAQSQATIANVAFAVAGAAAIASILLFVFDDDETGDVVSFDAPAANSAAAME